MCVCIQYIYDENLQKLKDISAISVKMRGMWGSRGVSLFEAIIKCFLLGQIPTDDLPLKFGEPRQGSGCLIS